MEIGVAPKVMATPYLFLDHKNIPLRNTVARAHRSFLTHEKNRSAFQLLLHGISDTGFMWK